MMVDINRERPLTLMGTFPHLSSYARSSETNSASLPEAAKVVRCPLHLGSTWKIVQL